VGACCTERWTPEHRPQRWTMHKDFRGTQGLRPLRRTHTRRKLGPLRFQGPRRSILGSENRQHTTHVARPQELRHLRGAKSIGWFIRYWLGRYASTDLELQECLSYLNWDVDTRIGGGEKRGNDIAEQLLRMPGRTFGVMDDLRTVLSKGWTCEMYFPFVIVPIPYLSISLCVCPDHDYVVQNRRKY